MQREFRFHNKNPSEAGPASLLCFIFFNRELFSLFGKCHGYHYLKPISLLYRVEIFRTLVRIDNISYYNIK